MSTVDQQLEEVRETIDDVVPRGITISEVTYEGPELVIYTQHPKEFAADADLVRQLASKLRKRITVRPDPDVLSRPDEAEEQIREIIPDDAGVTDVAFDRETGEVRIEARKPGVVIGRGGERRREITTAVGWTPTVVRTPPIESETVERVREFLQQEREERRSILERVGRQIHREPMANDEWVRISSLGGCREVGRAAFVISTPNTRVLVDCGDKPGAPEETPYLDVPEALGAGASTIDAVVLTHAHLDHAALVPLLYDHGYDGPIYCTEPTRDLLGLLTLDYIDRAEAEGRSAPYAAESVREAIKHTITLEYGDVTDIAPDVKLTLHGAGHVIGSSVVHFHVGEGLYNVAFTGDIHHGSTRLLDGAVNEFPRVETLVVESTYGGRNDYQTDQGDSERKLANVIRDTVERDGTVLVPTPAAGRAQEVMAFLEESMREGDIPEVPVHLDGPIWAATAVHTTYPEYLRNRMEERIYSEEKNPFRAEQFAQFDGDAADRQAIVDDGGGIVLATPGMLTDGPARDWLELIGDDEDSALAFVEYQAQGTIGRHIQNGTRELRPRDGGDPVDLALRIETVDGFSGHADRQGLENYVNKMRPRPEKVLCVDGEDSAVQDLSSGLYHEYSLRTFAPENLETFRFR